MRNFPKYDVETIKSTVSVQDALEFYAHIRTKPGKGRCPCPIHNGDDNNLSYSNDKFYCFVCGFGGDVIDFVQALFNIPFRDALEKLAHDFGIAEGVDPVAVAKRQKELKMRRDREYLEKENFKKFLLFYKALKDYPQSDMRDYFLNSMSATLDSMILNHNAADYDVDSILEMMTDHLAEESKD